MDNGGTVIDGGRWWRHAGGIAMVAVAIASCTALDPGSAPPAERCAQAEPAGRSAVDWTAAPAIAVTIDGGVLRPMVLDLHKGQPYRLVLSNRDNEERTFAAADLLDHAAQAGLQRPGRPAAAAACQAAVTIAPGETVELPLIPLRRGRYQVAGDQWPVTIGTDTIGVVYVR